MKTLDSGDRTGAVVCIIGILCNLVLSAGKIALGLLTGYVSVTADGFNNLSDCGSGAVALVSFFIAKKPADRKHPFGHRRAEYIASMVAGFFILFLAAELLWNSVETVIAPHAPAEVRFVYLALGLSVAVKLGMFALYRIFAKKLDSAALKAAATDSLCDSLATAAVIVGTVLAAYFPAADGWAGIVVSLFIAWQGIGIFAEAGSQLLGRAPDPALAQKIKEIVLAKENVLGVHDLQIYGYGKGVSFATIHAEIDASLSLLAAHAVIDGLEVQVKKETGVLLTIHPDPVDLDNFEEERLRIIVREAARGLAEDAEVHDLRLAPEDKTVSFDVGVPYDCKLSDEELTRDLADRVKELTGYEPVIRIDRNL